MVVIDSMASNLFQFNAGSWINDVSLNKKKKMKIVEQNNKLYWGLMTNNYEGKNVDDKKNNSAETSSFRFTTEGYVSINCYQVEH